MVLQPQKDIREVIRELGKFPADAFQFVQEGLSYTVEQAHGEMSDLERALHQFMSEHNIDMDRLEELYLNEQLPEQVCELIEETGGIDSLNRHVSGQNLCWGLRDYALRRWGAMASVVLRHWNIRRTLDFGEIVFALVNNDFLQKQSNDSLDDFTDVYDFGEAFEGTFKIRLPEHRN